MCQKAAGMGDDTIDCPTSDDGESQCHHLFIAVVEGLSDKFQCLVAALTFQQLQAGYQ